MNSGIREEIQMTDRKGDLNVTGYRIGDRSTLINLNLNLIDFNLFF